MSKGKKDKNRVFVVNLKHDGIFSPYPFSYIHSDEKQLTDFDFEGMSYDNLRELVRKMVHSPAGYESKWVVDLYVEHHGYEPMDYKNSNASDYEAPDSNDAYCSSDDEHVIDYVDFYHEGEQDVVVKNITTNDLFMTKLCSNNGNFRGFINEPILVNEDLHIEDPDYSSLEHRHQIQRGIAYPRHDPLQPWNEMQPILGMRYDHPEQLKLALANYGVAGRFQLWFKKNDWRELHVYYGRDVSTGRCTGKDGEGSSRNSDVSPKWTKSKIASSKKSGQPQCGFRLWASWMSTENSFQIKSHKAEHKCARNYNLGSLITYKWIAHHFAKEIIADPFIPLLKMKAVIREKFLINVSLGQVILDTNPGSTCILDEEETEYGNTYFRRFYICFKGVKDGWKAGCRRVIRCCGLGEASGALVEMKTKAMNLEDRITPSIKKRLKILKEQQRFWTVIPSGFQELEVRQGVPCVYSVAAYLFLNKEPDEGVDHWYSQERWFEASQFSIKPIYGSNMWKKQPNKPLLPPTVVRMPGKPRKNRVKAKSENNSQVSRDGSIEGRGQASGDMGDASGGRGQASGGLGEESGALGRARGRGGRGRGRGVTTMLVDKEEEIRKNMEHEYMEQILIKEEEKRIAAEKTIQEEFDEEAVRLTLEEEAIYEKEY
ncbi:hypothetical protein Tco_1001392 [Tanacetum coccineum]